MSSTVCRFFAMGNCRFGDNCWYAHETPHDRNRSYASSSYHGQQEKSPMNRRPHFTQSSVQDIVDVIAEEAKQAEYGHMWPMTCLSVMANSRHVPGWVDLSMEELRYYAYIAKANGRFNEYIEYYQNMKLKSRESRLMFLKPGKTTYDVVRRMIDDASGKSMEPSFGHNFSPFVSGGSFGNNTHSQSSFSNSSGFPSSGSVFGFTSKDPAPGLFAMASQGFKSAPFSQSSQSNDFINDTAMETAHDFSMNFTQPAASSTFQQNNFGGLPASPPSGTVSSGAPNLFGSASQTLLSSDGGSTSFPGFGAVPPLSSNKASVNNNNPAYSLMEELTEEELEQFKATTFTLQKLPLRPPPQELC